jgi:hypothetical protein
LYEYAAEILKYPSAASFNLDAQCLLQLHCHKRLARKGRPRLAAGTCIEEQALVLDIEILHETLLQRYENVIVRRAESLEQLLLYFCLTSNETFG